MKSWLYLLIAAAALSGCVGVSNVSRQAPFNAVVGQTLQTHRPTFLSPGLVRDSTGEALVSGGHSVLVLHDLSQLHTAEEWRKKVASIPAGQPIRVLEVRREMGDGDFSFTAVGEIFVPSTGKFTRFYYDWGYMATLLRAPWEADSVPKERPLP